MMKTARTLTVAAIVTGLLVVTALMSVTARSEGDDFDAAAIYQSKCQMCHGSKAEKKFDAAKPDSEHVQIILKGKKPEKPPNMPAYEEKGITEDQAKALLVHMKAISKQ